MEKIRTKQHIEDYCNSLKRNKITVPDHAVKKDFEATLTETRLHVNDLASLLALMEKHYLLDKPNCVNKGVDFYQTMYKKMKL